MKKILIALFASIFCIHLQAQLPKEERKNRVRTESIGFNITPMGAALVSAVPVNIRYGLWYKHEIKPGLRLRIGLNGQVFDIHNVSGDDEYYSEQIDDSTMKSVAKYDDEWNADLRVGIEYFKGGTNNGWVIGADFIVGNAMENSGYSTYTYHMNSMGYYPYYMYFESTSDEHFFRETGYLYTGLQVSAGYRALLTRWLEFQVQIVPEIRVEVPVRDDIDTNLLMSTESVKPAETRVRFGLQPIECFLFYRF